MRVRVAERSDLDALVELSMDIQHLHATGRPDLFRLPDRDALTTFLQSRLDDDSIVLIAVDASQAVGYLLAEDVQRPVSPFRHASHSYYVHHVAVDPASQRRGVGKLLLDDTVARASNAGAQCVRLDSWVFNEEAHEFFGKQGFAPVNIVFERLLTDRAALGEKG